MFSCGGPEVSSSTALLGFVKFFTDFRQQLTGPTAERKLSLSVSQKLIVFF